MGHRDVLDRRLDGSGREQSAAAQLTLRHPFSAPSAPIIKRRNKVASMALFSVLDDTASSYWICHAALVFGFKNTMKRVVLRSLPSSRLSKTRLRRP